MSDIYAELFPAGDRPVWATLASLRGELAAVTDQTRPVRVAADDGSLHLVALELTNVASDEYGRAVVLETGALCEDAMSVGELVEALDAALEAARTCTGEFTDGPWDDRPILAAVRDWYANVKPMPPGAVTDDGAHDGAPVVIGTTDDYDTRQW